MTKNVDNKKRRITFAGLGIYLVGLIFFSLNLPFLHGPYLGFHIVFPVLLLFTLPVAIAVFAVWNWLAERFLKKEKNVLDSIMGIAGCLLILTYTFSLFELFSNDIIRSIALYSVVVITILVLILYIIKSVLKWRCNRKALSNLK